MIIVPEILFVIAGVLIASRINQRARAKERQRTRELEAALRNVFERKTHTNGYKAESIGHHVTTRSLFSMKVSKVGKVLLTLTPLMLVAGAAFAATSGVGAIDQPLNTLGHVAAATGYIIGGVGAVGIIHHIRSGSWLGAAEHLGVATFGGAVVYNYAGLAPSFGGAASALVHSVVTHPAAHLAINAVARMVG